MTLAGLPARAFRGARPCWRVVATGTNTLKLSVALNQEVHLAWAVKVTDEYAAWFTTLIKEDLASATQVA